ncbi:hypothetical protein L210DRAFT_3511567 [Boletus edulis BED1]|uniref:Putative 5'-nucleotidase C-terminal domain-containing protein n=1 Tax=Boletus edulis BED1 TaxID=1328754 RepID=A0AAD4BBY0_BOLED|nr:hypothetical protein L210DRAFT_3511567 [Boletus edulis BED1]
MANSDVTSMLCVIICLHHAAQGAPGASCLHLQGHGWLVRYQALFMIVKIEKVDTSTFYTCAGEVVVMAVMTSLVAPSHRIVMRCTVMKARLIKVKTKNHGCCGLGVGSLRCHHETWLWQKKTNEEAVRSPLAIKAVLYGDGEVVSELIAQLAQETYSTNLLPIKNHQLMAEPFTNLFYYIPNVTLSVVNQVLPALNGGSNTKRSKVDKELWGHGWVESQYRNWLQDMHERQIQTTNETNLMLRYGCPGAGDDMLHIPLPYYSVPNASYRTSLGYVATDNIACFDFESRKDVKNGRSGTADTAAAI